jgi:hypothetical protein
MKPKLYLEPLGENGLPLHNTANIDNCMKSYKKVVGIFIDKEILSCFLEWCILKDKDIYDSENRLKTSVEFLKRNV